MQLTSCSACALLLTFATFLTFAQNLPPAPEAASTAPNAGTLPPSHAPAPRTGKERLGEKWKDEQRIDNCNVPLDKRGTKPRPDFCPSP